MYKTPHVRSAPCRPAAQAEAVMARLPSGLTSSSSTAPSERPRVNTLALDGNSTLAKPHISRRGIEHANRLASDHTTSGRGVGRSEHMTHAIESRHLRIQTHLLLGNLGSMSDERLILLSPNSRAIGKRGKRIGKQLTAKLTKLHRERIAGCSPATRCRPGHNKRPDHAMSNAHNGNASNLITSKNGTLNGSSATPTRQQGRMNVHDTERRHMQHLIRQNAAISSHTENISLHSLERLNNQRHTISLSTTGRPSSSALALTGDGSSFLPRPRTASGRVITSAISFPASTSEVSEGTAKSGVPINTIRIKNVSPQPKPRRLQTTAESQVPSPSAITIQQEQIYPKPKKEPQEAALPTKQLTAKTPLPGPRHPGETSTRPVPGAPAYIVPRAVSQRSENV